MALDGAGLGLALVSELTRTAKSIRERYESYQEGPVLFSTIDATLTRLSGITGNLDKILAKKPETVPLDVLPDFVGTLTVVKDTLLNADNAVAEYCSRAFIASSSNSCLKQIANKGRRFFKAKTLTALMTSIRSDTSEAENKLQHLTTQLCTALKIDETALKSNQNLRSIIEEHITPGEKFRATFNAPMLPGKVCLDFESKDVDGTFAAPEGTFKYLVLMGTSARNVTVARGGTGDQLPVHGVSGMAGVGKTIALIGLGHDDDIKARFVDGVLYISVGASATVGHLTSELCRIMRITGAVESAAEVQSSESLSDAVSNAAVWFHGKRILFLIDDIWPTTTCSEGFLPDLEGLLQGNPDCRFAISTRSLHVAGKGGSHVHFCERDPCGRIAMSIFMAQAAPKMHATEDLLDETRGILELCSGLPIALSVAGAAVCMRISSGAGFKFACRMYLKELTDEMTLHPFATVLENAIRLSLAALSSKMESNGSEARVATKYSARELYESLCVLENQQFAPVSVLARMWTVSETKAENICTLFSSLSLAKISIQSLDEHEQCGLLVHDLHLEYCRQNATKSGDVRIWHKRLLGGHIPMHEDDARDEVDEPLGVNMLEYTPRPWWKDELANKEYIRKHLSRHLQSSGLYLELGSTLLDLRWISVQGREGGILRLKNDLGILEAAVEEKFTSALAHDPSRQYELAPVKLISTIIAAQAADLLMATRVLAHLFFADLFLFSTTNEFVALFLERMKNVLPKPFLEARVSFYRPPGDELKYEIDLISPEKNDFAYFSTDFSSCSRYCVAGVNHGVGVFSLETMNRLTWLMGHEKHVSVVKFCSDAARVISGSLDYTIVIWDWQQTELPACTLRGHKGAVTALSLGSDDTRLFSGSQDGTVRMWDMITCELCREFIYDLEVECVASCSANEMVAVGTIDGCLHCMNCVSGQSLFEYHMNGSGAVSAVQFGSDGLMLVAGSSLGHATCWRTSDWRKGSIVRVPGSITNVAFHPDGTNVILGSSEGEIRHWDPSEDELSMYNVSMARPVNGLSFLNNGNDIVVGVKLGYARVWSGPQLNPSLDFEAFRNNLLFDFALSADGSRVATTTHDSMIRIWRTDTCAQVTEYYAPVDGSHRLALSADGSKIASSSPNGTICIWNSDMSPRDEDILLRPGSNEICCISFSPGGSRLLVSLPDEVQIWNWETREKFGQVPSLGSSNTAFSSNGRFIIVGDTTRVSLWDSSGIEVVFDTASASPQKISFSEAKNAIQTCGPSAHRMWPSPHRVAGTALCPLTVENIFNFVTYHFRPENIAFCEDVFVLSHYGVLILYKIRK